MKSEKQTTHTSKILNSHTPLVAQARVGSRMRLAAFGGNRLRSAV